MARKTLAIFGILAMLLIMVFGTVAAQDEPPVTSPEPTEDTETESQFLTHPVVKLLGAYFGRSTGETEEDPEDPADPADPTDPTLPTEPPVTPETVAAEIATYHEEGMGFGVLVKLYAMAEASKEACEAETAEQGEGVTPAEGEVEGETCTPLTVDALVTELKSGVGMGALYKDHGKPALLGVGHVKKALKNQEQITDDSDEETDLTTKEKKNNKPPKAKAPKGKGK